MIILAQTSNEPGVPTLDIEFERFQYPITYPDASRVKYQCEEIARSTPSQVTIDLPVFYYFSVSHLPVFYLLPIGQKVHVGKLGIQRQVFHVSLVIMIRLLIHIQPQVRVLHLIYLNAIL